MAVRISCVTINDDNAGLFEFFTAPDPSLDSGGRRRDIGILAADEPIGRVAVDVYDDRVEIKSVRIRRDHSVGEAMDVLLDKLVRECRAGSIRRLTCSFAGDESGEMQAALKSAGFELTKRPIRTYVIDAVMLGFMLRDSAEITMMKKNYEDLAGSGRIRSFADVDVNLADSLGWHDADPDLSSVILDADGFVTDYAVVSRISDETVYFNGFHVSKGDEKDAPGLLYSCLCKIFLDIEPMGELMVAAMDEQTERLVEHLTETVRAGIDEYDVNRAELTFG